MDELRGLKNILKKLMVLNSSRMEYIRDSFVTTEADSAEYEERYSEQQWYKESIEEINVQIVGKDLKISRDTLKSNIKAKLESRYDEVLENIRKAGAGHMVDPELISQEDREFLGSCGIKADRGERW